jgi:hypothetical protein
MRLACSLLLVLTCFAAETSAAERPNILFIAVDDLNDWVGCLGGHPQAETPNIDALAARGVNFAKAYCACPVCNPSRTALMVGLRSSTTGVYNNGINRRDSKAAMSVPPLNTYFHQQGYYVAGAGKIYHGDGDQFGEWDDYAKPHRGDIAPAAGASGGVGGIRFAPVDAPDEQMGDYHTVSYCIEQLQKKHDKPFFLACGLHKPHMAWNVPQKYYDQFPLDSIELPKVLETDLEDVPPAGVKMARPEGSRRHPQIGPLEGSGPGLPGRWRLLRRDDRPLDGSLRQERLQGQLDHRFLGRSRLASRRKAALAQVHALGRSRPRPALLRRPRRHQAEADLCAARRFHEHLPHALRPRRPADSITQRRR